ncbi:MAG TPA: hypothetical protein VMP12_13385, partial [Candidatus Sulfotelmatobacter sp.]|nr:hypothetical protein [Candidatus Sulfotelmatobacter sp.]
MIESPRNVTASKARARFKLRAAAAATVFALALLLSLPLRADEPYARTRDYDLQHSKITLKFDTDQRKVIGNVTHSVSILRENTTRLSFDSVGLTIQSVAVNKSAAKFETTPAKLLVSLPGAPKVGDQY